MQLFDNCVPIYVRFLCIFKILVMAIQMQKQIQKQGIQKQGIQKQGFWLKS
jgi:hypothetical protein